VPPSPPQPHRRGRSRSLDELDFSNVKGSNIPNTKIVKPTARKAEHQQRPVSAPQRQVYPKRPGSPQTAGHPKRPGSPKTHRSPKPGSPRHQVVNNLAGGRKIHDIVDAINRSRPSSPERGSPQDNWSFGVSPNLNITPPDSSLERPPVTPRKNGRQEDHLGDDNIDLGVPDLPPRRHSFDSRGTFVMQKGTRSDRRSSEDSNLYEQLHHLPVISSDTGIPQDKESAYEHIPAIRRPSVAEWIQNTPDNIPDIIEPDPDPDPEPVPSPSSIDEDYMYRGRKASSIDTARTRISVASISSQYGLTVAPEEDNTEEEESKNDNCSNAYIVVTKWFAAILVSGIVLACVTFNKICLMSIGRAYIVANATNTTLSASSNGQGYKESIVLMLVLILMIPQGFTVFVGIWSKKRSQLWPSKSAVILVSKYLSLILYSKRLRVHE